MNKIFALLALMVLAGCQDQDEIGASIQNMAKDSASKTPAAVVAWGKSIVDEMCSGEGFEASGEPIIVIQHDLNLDGTLDYVTSTSGLRCTFDGTETLSALAQGQVPVWGLLLSGEGDNYRAETFAAVEIEPFKFDQQDVLLVARGGAGIDQPKYAWAAWGWDQEQDTMRDFAFYDANKQRINKDGTRFDARQQAGSIAFPPIEKGYYAQNTTCAEAIRFANADEPPTSLIYFHPTALIYGPEGGPQISGYKDLGNGMYWVQARTYGNGEDDKGTQADFTIKVVNRNEFEMDKASFFYCPLSTVPKDIRDNWYEFFFE